MRPCRRRLILAALAPPLLPLPAHAAAVREAHGASDAWAEAGLAIAFAVLRGRDEASTRVVVRIAAEPALRVRVAVAGRDPFGGGVRELLAPSQVRDLPDLLVPRAHFADWPRTEFRFDGDVALLVYFLGVPDTTPEFDAPEALRADLARRISRARAQHPPTGR